ncbi:MAG TPA: ammonium transporter, partial [Bacteroidota bacterium]|nr:ammonium transporter [Bacteroidota bacterium]
LGVILLGIFASLAFNPAGTNGLLEGNVPFFLKQVLATVISSVWAFGFTYAMLWLINKITPVRVEEGAEGIGLDEAIHGEKAYTDEEVFVGARQ